MACKCLDLITICGLTMIFICLSNRLRLKIRDALQGNEVGPVMDPTKFSRNYRMGSVEGNMLFEGTSYLPKEAMLEMTLKAFGYEIDMMEVNMPSYFIQIVQLYFIINIKKC